MSAQQELPLPSPAASNTVIINARCSLRIEADQRAIVVSGVPVHHYFADDAAAEAYAMLRPHYARADQEGRTVLHELFATAGDIRVCDRELQITLAPLSSPHRTHAAQALCERLDQTVTPNRRGKPYWRLLDPGLSGAGQVRTAVRQQAGHSYSEYLRAQKKTC